ncbi:flagellin [Tardiphaga alba]|uniref:Flagellin n=1 Tax=Tardiphaga alba TaxID=340268 RepID=A0ABX8ACJ8_9BRAD|nr:flagellin [Tardiphaga alba]QUS40987.1 flagellin [Tardiphaga alba]
MSGITLSASVRQNLLSLQSTADLLSTTQNRLATGNKVNSALDNPTNFFTAQSLNNRASDINNLLDGIGNGVQVIQAANTGITSLQKLVDSAKSIANQALQATTGYTKSSVASEASGATAANLLGTTAATTSSVTGSVKLNNISETFTAGFSALGTAITSNTQGAYVAPVRTGANIAGITDGTSLVSDISTNTPAAGQTLTIGSTTFGIVGTGTASTASTISVDDDIDSVLTKINSALTAAGGGSAVLNGTAIDITGNTGSSLTIGGTAAAGFGLTSGTFARTNAPHTPTAVTTGSLLAEPASPTSNGLATPFTTSDTITVNNTTINFYDSGAGQSTPPALANNVYLDLASTTVANLKTAIDNASGGSLTVNAQGQFRLATGTATDVTLGGTGVGKLGLATGTVARTSAPAVAAPVTGATTLKGAVGTNSLTANFTSADKITVNGKTIGFYDSSLGETDPLTTNTTSFDLATADVADVLAQIDIYSGNTGTASSVVGGKVQLNAGTLADLDLGGTTGTLAKLGLTAGVTDASKAAGGSLSGQTLTIASVGGGTATNITFGTADGEVSTLAQLNTNLAANNLQASISSTGKLTITTTNDNASLDIGLIGGTVTGTGGIFEGKTASAAEPDAASQATRASFVAQFNQVIDNIRTTAQDSSFNGVNLLNGDTLSLTFNETGKSKLDISGVSFGPDGLGLSALKGGTDFIDNASTNKILASLNNASSQLRSQASAFGSNLSIVQMRQDFSKNLINVLQTGASNLTLADTNEEAANSQALSTRQSIAVSSLALANQSQQGVLQLLR